MKKVTIKDIAKLAGVSYATVSRALSGSPEISEETSKRVLEICKKEGYRANSLARSLVSNRTNLIGLIVPDIVNPFYAEIAFQVETYARTFGYSVMLCNSQYNHHQVEELFSFLVGHQADGVILASSRDESRNLISRHYDAMPTVLLGDCISEAYGSTYNLVSLDNFSGGRLGADYLYELGHRDIVYLGMRSGSTTHARRVSGFSAAMQSHGVTPTIIENLRGSSTIEGGYALGKELFASHIPDAIFAATDSVALGIMKAADEYGIRIPEDVSLLGFDNYMYSSLPKIQLTTIDQRKQQLCEVTVDLLLQLIDTDEHNDFTRRVIRPVLIERSTCSPR